MGSEIWKPDHLKFAQVGAIVSRNHLKSSQKDLDFEGPVIESPIYFKCYQGFTTKWIIRLKNWFVFRRMLKAPPLIPPLVFNDLLWS